MTMRITVDLPADLVEEIERRLPDATWSQLIIDSLVFALTEADEQAEHDEHTSTAIWSRWCSHGTAPTGVGVRGGGTGTTLLDGHHTGHLGLLGWNP
jgi:hypothetical protein